MYRDWQKWKCFIDIASGSSVYDYAGCVSLQCFFIKSYCFQEINMNDMVIIWYCVSWVQLGQWICKKTKLPIDDVFVSSIVETKFNTKNSLETSVNTTHTPDITFKIMFPHRCVFLLNLDSCFHTRSLNALWVSIILLTQQIQLTNQIVLALI